MRDRKRERGVDYVCERVCIHSILDICDVLDCVCVCIYTCMSVRGRGERENAHGRVSEIKLHIYWIRLKKSEATERTRERAREG